MRNKQYTQQQSHFAAVPRLDKQRNQFVGSGLRVFDFDASKIIPFYKYDLFPGDTIELDVEHLTRLQTPIVPTFGNVFLDIHAYAVPHRLTWDHWKNMHGERIDPDDSVDYSVPMITTPSGGHDYFTNQDYLGLPPKVENYTYSALPLRALHMVWNDHYRDQNLQESFTVAKGDTDTTDYTALLPRCKRPDYFTSALPFRQKGDEILLPLAGTAPLAGSLATPVLPIDLKSDVFWTEDSGATEFTGTLNARSNVTGGSSGDLDFNNTESGEDYDYDNASHYIGINVPSQSIDYSGISVDLASAGSVSIHDLRDAVVQQHQLENDALSGTRYTEIISHKFGIDSPDSRLQRPEYIGGSTSSILITPIAQTSVTDAASTPQGNLAAVGESYDKKKIVYTAQEHTIILVVMSARVDQLYQQGVHRSWSWETREDWWSPEYVGISEQAIYNKEIYVQDDTTDTGSTGTPDNERVFGYQQPFSERKFPESYVSGSMRSSHPQSQDLWHYANDFDSLPTLSEEFIVENAPIDRTIAVQDEKHFRTNMKITQKLTTCMPVYNKPGVERI